MANHPQAITTIDHVDPVRSVNVLAMSSRRRPAFVSFQAAR